MVSSRFHITKRFFEFVALIPIPMCYVELHSTNPTNEENLCSMLNKKPM
ncbi:Uncharacterised protein [Vibrio cholerae]|nr:Uncharacterised protein [Vibrio cholerae]